MVEVVGDICVPSELILPTRETNAPAKKGALFISGGKLLFYTGSAIETITSS